jgi:hypothetical protein
MSKAHVEKFAELVSQDSALLESLKLDTVVDLNSGATVLGQIVSKAKAMGLEFSNEEAAEWFQAYLYKGESGELSDVQLEVVAGGKSKYGGSGASSAWITNGIHASMQQAGYGADMSGGTSARKIAGKR